MKVCTSCRIRSYHRSGWAIKSPPKDKWNHQFHRRWFVMVTVELCGKCELIYSALGKCLMLFYYVDDREQNLKGIFKIEDAAMHETDHIDSAPTEELSRQSFVLRLELPSHQRRLLYLIFKNKVEQQSWVNAFQNYVLEKNEGTTTMNKEMEEFAQKEVERHEAVEDSCIEKEIRKLREERKTSALSDEGFPVDEITEEMCEGDNETYHTKSLSEKMYSG